MGKNRKEIRDQMFAKEILIKQNQIPKDWSTEAADLINKVRLNNILALKEKAKRASRKSKWLTRYKRPRLVQECQLGRAIQERD